MAYFIIKKIMGYTTPMTIVPKYRPYSLEWATSETNKWQLISQQKSKIFSDVKENTVSKKTLISML